MDEDRSKKFSPSKLDTYKTCPRQYKFRYIDRLRSDSQSVEAFLGSCVHRGLEELYAARMHGRLLSEAEVLAVYEKEWAAGFTDKVVLRDPRYGAEDWRRTGAECLSAYYKAHAPFDRERTVAVEKRIGFPLEVADPEAGASEACRIEGFIDRLALAPDGWFEIHDYKTSQSLPTQAQKDQDWQLAIYDIAVREAWPDAPGVRLVWHFVRHGKRIVSTRSAEQLARLKGDIAALILAIKRDHVFEPVKSALCDWCDFKDRCPLWGHAESLAKLPENERRGEDGARLAAAYAGLDARKKALRDELAACESEQADLERRLLAYADGKGLLAVAGEDAVIDISAKEEFRFPTRTAAPDKVALIESELKATAVWPAVSRLDPKALMDGYRKRAWPEAVQRLIEGWLDRLIRRETVRTLRVRRRKEAEDE